jgi:hypothetical protein
MFDIDNRDLIMRLICERYENELVIPLYVNIYNKKYSISEINEIKDYSSSIFKVGFGSASSLFMKNSFPTKHIYEFSNVTTFTEYDDNTNTATRYYIFESSYIDNEYSELYKQINSYISILEEYIDKHVKELKKELIRIQMEEF